jgi:hypothetical protein
MRRHLFRISFAVLIFAVASSAQSNFVEKAPELQKTALRATGGAMGCGHGSFTVVASKERIKVSSSLDPIHVFGSTIYVSDLLTLLTARAKSNRTGEVNPMSGEVGQLTYVTLLVLSSVKEKSTVSVTAELLTDKDDTIRAWSAITLYRLAQSDKGMKSEVEKIVFPKLAVQSAKGRGVEPPDWLRIADGS